MRLRALSIVLVMLVSLLSLFTERESWSRVETAPSGSAASSGSAVPATRDLATSIGWPPDAAVVPDAGVDAACPAHHDAIEGELVARVCVPMAARLAEAAARCCAGLRLEDDPAAGFVEHCRDEARFLSIAGGCAGAVDEAAVAEVLAEADFACDVVWTWSPGWSSLLGGAAVERRAPEAVDRALFGAPCTSLDDACGEGMVCDHGRRCGRDGPFVCMPRSCARPHYHAGPSHTCDDECGG